MEKFLSYIKRPVFIKSIILIVIYFLSMLLLADYIYLLVQNILCSSNNVDVSVYKEWLLNPDRVTNDLFMQISVSSSAVVNFSMDLLMTILAVILFFKDIKANFNGYRMNSKKFSTIFLSGILIVYATEIFASVLSQAMLQGIYDGASKNQEMIEMIFKSSAANALMMAICTCIFAPILEELVFRKSIFEVCKNKYVSIAVSGLLFGVVHALSSSNNPLIIFGIALPYAATGLCFAALYEKSNRNIFTTILLHFTLNTISTIMILIMSLFI